MNNFTYSRFYSLIYRRCGPYVCSSHFLCIALIDPQRILPSSALQCLVSVIANCLHKTETNPLKFYTIFLNFKTNIRVWRESARKVFFPVTKALN